MGRDCRPGQWHAAQQHRPATLESPMGALPAPVQGDDRRRGGPVRATGTLRTLPRPIASQLSNSETVFDDHAASASSLYPCQAARQLAWVGDVHAGFELTNRSLPPSWSPLCRGDSRAVAHRQHCQSTSQLFATITGGEGSPIHIKTAPPRRQAPGALVGSVHTAAQKSQTWVVALLEIVICRKM